MDRNSYIEKLSSWNGSSRRKPLILEGARQVGKTWLMREFARTHYKNAVYVRFDKDKLLRRIFDADFDVERIVHELEIAKHVKIKPETTILLFDEIQACKNALTSLKYFAEIPSASSVGPHSRVMRYRVMVAKADGSAVVERLVAPPLICLAERRSLEGRGTCAFGREELPRREKLVVSVAPLNAGGKSGKPISKEIMP